MERIAEPRQGRGNPVVANATFKFDSKHDIAFRKLPDP
jgi:hypothetical protein